MPRPMASAILGNCVVLPEPVSPQTMTTWWAAIAAVISSRLPETGSDSGKVMVRGVKAGTKREENGRKECRRAATAKAANYRRFRMVASASGLPAAGSGRHDRHIDDFPAGLVKPGDAARVAQRRA